MDKKERFNKVYDYLKWTHKIKTQADVADAMHSTKQNVSAALAGKPNVLTDNFLARFCTAYPEISKKWLIEGTGTMLEGDGPPKTPELPEEQSSLVNALLAAKDETIEAQQRELKTKDELIRFLKEEIENLKREKKSAQEWVPTMSGVAEKENAR